MKSLIPKEEPKDKESKGPSLEELKAQQEAEAAKLRADMEIRSSQFSNQMHQLERTIERRMGTAQPQPQAQMTAEEAQKDLGITQEQLLTDPSAVQKLTDHIRAQTRAEMQGAFEAYNEHVSGLMGNLAETTFAAQMNELKAEPYYADLAQIIAEHFEDNPEARGVAGAPRRVYNELVGQNIADLQKLQTARAAKEEESKASSSSVEPPLRTNPAPIAGKKTPEAPQLDERREYILQTYNGLGINMSPEEYVGIESGKLLPKKVAADTQRGAMKTDADY